MFGLLDRHFTSGMGQEVCIVLVKLHSYIFENELSATIANIGGKTVGVE